MVVRSFVPGEGFPLTVYVSEVPFHGGVVSQEMYKRIMNEVKGLTNHPWAGHYSSKYGPTWSTTVREAWVGPKSGWVENCQGCEGGGATYGTVVETNGMAHLLPDGAKIEDFVWVNWEGQDYLVHKKGMFRFCQHYCLGGRPGADAPGAVDRIPPRPVLLGRNLTPGAPPKVPAEFEKYLLPNASPDEDDVGHDLASLSASTRWGYDMVPIRWNKIPEANRN